MLHHFRIDLVDQVLRKVKEIDAPFGGVQVVFCGDFFQLPPVHRAYEPEAHFAYHTEERGRHNIVEALKKSCLAPEVLHLKQGAKVMFVKNNFEQGYVNGTLGTVVKCGYEEIQVKTLSGNVINVERESWRVEEEGRTLAEIGQYPLRLAWAITIHKSQGMSLDAAEVDLSDSFEKGMGYVALSRVRSLAGLSLKGLNQRALEV